MLQQKDGGSIKGHSLGDGKIWKKGEGEIRILKEVKAYSTA